MLPADPATLSEEHQVELEKIQGVVMAMEARGPSEEVLSGARVCSTKCDDLNSLLFCRKQELVATKQSDLSTFYPESLSFLAQAVRKAKVDSERALTNCEKVSTW